MQTFSFTVVIDHDFDDLDFCDTIAGSCPDSFLTSDSSGHICLTFDRKAASVIDAIVSALNDLRSVAADDVISITPACVNGPRYADRVARFSRVNLFAMNLGAWVAALRVLRH